MAEPVIDFVSVGEQVLPAVPTLRCVPLADPHCAALYARRLDALASSTSDWMCFVDGDEDVIDPSFAPAMRGLVLRAAAQGVPIGWCAETEHGKVRRLQYPHHGVVCSTAALRAIDWPAGCYHWEAIAYRVLQRAGHVFDPAPRYDWRPGPGGARLWPSTRVGIDNAQRWLRREGGG